MAKRDLLLSEINYTIFTFVTIEMKFLELIAFQSLGCLLYAMAFLESPFDKIFAQGGSIALATQSDNVKFPDNSG